MADPMADPAQPTQRAQPTRLAYSAGTPDDAERALLESLRTPFDRVLADSTRVRVLAALIAVGTSGSITFAGLKAALQVSDGNLGNHLAVLAEVGYAEASEQWRGRRRTRWYAATAAGREALRAHIETLTALAEAAGLAPRQDRVKTR